MTVSLTAFLSDMLFGVGLGCLLQMVQTHSYVQVIFSSNTQNKSLWFWSNVQRNIKVTDTWKKCMWCIFFSFSSSVWSRGFVDVDSCSISGFVFGPVLRHCSPVPFPLGSGIRDFSHRLLCHLSSHCTTHRVWEDPHCVDLTLRPVWNEGCPPVM